MKDKIFQDKNFYNKLLHLTIPMALQSLMLASVAVADALMLGSVEQNAMSAVSLATQIQFVQNMILLAAAEAASILGAQYWGKKDVLTVNKIWGMTLKICGLLSILFFAGCVFFPRQLMLLFTDEEVLVEIGIGYLQIAGWSYLLTGIIETYLTIMKVSEHASMAAAISSGTVVINIVLNAVFIYGLLGMPEMGVRGAALATLIARILELLWAVGCSLRKDYLSLKLCNLFYHSKELLGDFNKCFMPLLGGSMLWGIGFTSYTAFMGHLGTDAAAANSVAAVVRDLVCCMCNGLATGGGILVGNELGAGNLDRGKLYGERIFKLAFFCGAISSAIMFALTPLIVLFVKLTPLAQHLLLQMMLVMSVYMIGRAVNTILINGLFAAGGDTLFDVYSLAVTMWCMAVPLAAIGTFVTGWPVWVVYACTCLDEVGKIPWVIYHFKKYKWVKDLTRR